VERVLLPMLQSISITLCLKTLKHLFMDLSKKLWRSNQTSRNETFVRKLNIVDYMSPFLGMKTFYVVFEIFPTLYKSGELKHTAPFLQDLKEMVKTQSSSCAFCFQFFVFSFLFSGFFTH
jgi:hypothetical protein